MTVMFKKNTEGSNVFTEMNRKGFWVVGFPRKRRKRRVFQWIWQMKGTAVMETQCLPHFRFSLCTDVSDYFWIVVWFSGTQGYREKGSQLLSCCFLIGQLFLKCLVCFGQTWSWLLLHVTQINPCLCVLDGFWSSLSFCRPPFEAPRQTAATFFKLETGARSVQRSAYCD